MKQQYKYVNKITIKNGKKIQFSIGVLLACTGTASCFAILYMAANPGTASVIQFVSIMIFAVTQPMLAVHHISKSASYGKKRVELSQAEILERGS